MATVVEGDQKAPISIAITPRCWEGTTPFPGLLHFTHTIYCSGSGTPQDTNCTATCPLSRNLIQVRRTRHAGHCWRSRDELIRDVLLWIPTHGRAKAGRPARTYIQQLCEDTGCCPEDLPRAMNDREEWRERVRDIRAASTIWWWWWYIAKCKARRYQVSFLKSLVWCKLELNPDDADHWWTLNPLVQWDL